jgi:23S rRNA G2445 N2-methylase RlmL
MIFMPEQLQIILQLPVVCRDHPQKTLVHAFVIDNVARALLNDRIAFQQAQASFLVTDRGGVGVVC